MSDEFELKEIEVFKKIAEMRLDINKFKNTFIHLHQYIARMDDLSTWKNQTCVNCKKKYDFLQYENLQFGFKETSFFCNECYYLCLEKLVKFAREL